MQQDFLFDEQPMLADADLRYQPDWLDRKTADQWLARLTAETPWSQPELLVYGRYHRTPRLVAWYGDDGTYCYYSNCTHEPLPWTPLLQEIRQRLQAGCDARFNAVLLNLYRDGNDAMGWHSDDEFELGREPLIASLSLGDERRFDFRRKGSNAIGHSLTLAHGSLLVMAGKTQQCWQHQVARTRRSTQPRLNLTFRLIRNLS